MLSYSPGTAARFCAAFVAVCTCCAAYSQSSIASVHRIFAIVGTRIEVGDGHVIEKGTVVIQSGIITAVGATVTVPAGADIVDGKGLTLYPGFIDAFTTKGFNVPTSSTAPASSGDYDTADYAPAFMREQNRRTIHPDTRALDNLGLTDTVLKPYYQAGFTTVLIAPTGGDMSGSAALMNLSGRPNRESAILSSAGQVVSFGGQGWGDGYPSSLLGHIAQLRQTFLDAEWYRAVARSWDAGGSQRPPSDDSLIALQPAITQKTPVIFDADTEYPIQRSLNIAAEFGLKPFLAGATEGWKDLDLLRKSGAPVLLSLAFSKDPSETKPKDGPPAPPNPDVVEKVIHPAKLGEQIRLYKEAIQNPAVLAKAGIPLALSTKGVASPSEFMENLRKAVAAGFDHNVALRALTLDSAKIFGVDRQLGSIAVGKTANLALLTGDFLKAETKVKLLYIDGRKIDPTTSVPPPAPRLPFTETEGN